MSEYTRGSSIVQLPGVRGEAAAAVGGAVVESTDLGERVSPIAREGAPLYYVDVSGVGNAKVRSRLQERVRELGYPTEFREGFLEYMASASADLPRGQQVVVADLARLARAIGLPGSPERRSTWGRSALSLVACVRQRSDEAYAASVDDLIRYFGQRVQVCNYAELFEPSGCLQRAFVSTDPRAVVDVRVSSIGDGSWVEFGDGLRAVFSWRELGLSELEPRLIPETTVVGRDPFSVEVLDENGGVFEIDSDVIRMLVDDGAAERFAREREANHQAVGERLRAKRKRRGVTQEVLAERSRLQQALISKLETGKHQPTFATLERYASGLGMTVREVLD